MKNKLKNHKDSIHLFWIKAHVGFQGNERADEYAKIATTHNTIDINVPLNIATLKKKLNKEIMTEWQTHWSNTTKGREVFALLPEVKTARLQGDFLINQLITGHGTLGKYQARFFNKTSICDCGHQQEDRTHIIYDCPLWKDIRSKFFPTNFKDSTQSTFYCSAKRPNRFKGNYAAKIAEIPSAQ
ncbi:RNase H domain-containing protein [Caerostris darwini]|uniref:RNase H domain-containing protein n=1 Tax=Caerostris darwini TaxID=1538125 RepID=A0AAV4WDD2_9ARAC|nr:RNase H domain-containing protein [Caerostris darwini]